MHEKEFYAKVTTVCVDTSVSNQICPLYFTVFLYFYNNYVFNQDGKPSNMSSRSEKVL